MVIITSQPTRTITGSIATAAEVKKQLNIESTFTDDDTYIGTLIDVAVETVEDDTHSDIQNVSNLLTYTLAHDETPQTIYRITRCPLRTFSKLEKQVDGVWSTIATTAYEVHTCESWFEIHFLAGETFDALRFTFISGYTSATLPKKLKHAAILKAADLYDTDRSNHVVGTILATTGVYEKLIYSHVRKYW